MDEQRFDRLVRALADRATRRGVLAVLASLTGLGAGDSLARRHRRKQRGKHVQAAACRTLNQSCTPKRPKGPGKWRKCCRGLLCQDKLCRPPDCASGVGSCGNGGHCCGRVCVDLQTDPKNCGRCSHDCGGSPCVGGSCVSPCVAGWTYCDGECVDLLRDNQHCGTCSTVCQHSTTCEQGQCLCLQRGDVCDSDDECCQDAQKAPLADPRDWDSSVRCDDAGGSGLRCCVGRGSACRDSYECCSANETRMQCLGEDYGCGFCIGPGQSCPSQCPPDGPCDLCCDKWCDKGFCRTTCQPAYWGCGQEFDGPCCNGLACIAGSCLPEDSCQNFGQPCSPLLLECCAGLRCNDGICALSCVPYAGACQSAGECCDGVPCTGGLCRFN